MKERVFKCPEYNATVIIRGELTKDIYKGQYFTFTKMGDDDNGQDIERIIRERRSRKKSVRMGG